MSNSVAPLPSGVGVASIAEHRPRREQEAHHQSDDDARPDDDRDAAPQDSEPREHREGPAPTADEELVPAATLFATALIANSLLPQAPSPEELKLRTNQGWTPPDSPLRLKDKLI